MWIEWQRLHRWSDITFLEMLNWNKNKQTKSNGHLSILYSATVNFFLVTLNLIKTVKFMLSYGISGLYTYFCTSNDFSEFVLKWIWFMQSHQIPQLGLQVAAYWSNQPNSNLLHIFYSKSTINIFTSLILSAFRTESLHFSRLR